MKTLRENPKFMLAFLALFSLVFISTVDRFFFRIFPASLELLADLRLTSLLIVSLFYFGLRKIYAFNPLPKPQRARRVTIMAVTWLSMTAFFVLVKKVWIPSLETWVDLTAFMLTGLVAEEILFRGILFDLSERVFKAGSLFKISYPVFFTSLLFGLQHLSYHDFKINSASLTQVAYTMAMGVVFASIKESSGRLWMVILFHMLSNSFTLMRNL